MPAVGLVELLNGYTFSGNWICLAQVTHEHLEGLRRILSDPVTMSELRYMAKLPAGWSLQEVSDRVNERKRRQNLGECLHLAVLQPGNGAVVGWCGFNEIVKEHQRAEFGVVIESALWGSGAAAECVLACLTFGFESLMLHRVEMSTFESNLRAIKLMEKIGAVREGIRREYLLHEGRFLTDVRFGLLVQEWPAAKGRTRQLLNGTA